MIRPEDEPKINRMTFALRASKEAACILLVSFNDELLRQDVEAEIKRRLEPEGFRFPEVHMREEEYKNLPMLLAYLKPQPEDIFLIFDLKKALPEVLEYLNYRREDFVEHNISAIFWLDEPTLTEITRKALDFYAFRSLPVFEFKVDHAKEMTIPGRGMFDGILTYNSREDLDDKIALREELLRDYMEKRPQDRFTIARFHNELGQLYYYKAQFDKALASIRKALELYKEMEDRRGEADALNNLGMVLQDLGDLAGAKENYERALEIDEAAFGSDHPRVARDVNNLGSVLHARGFLLHQRGDLEDAKRHLERALQIDQAVYGKDHPDVAIRLNNLGSVLYALGDLEDAKKHLERALQIDQAIYGPNHPNVATDLDNLGKVLHVLGDLEGAKQHYTRAIEIDEGVHGPDHPSVATSVNNLGAVLQDLGDLAGAEKYMRRALDIYERCLVYGHPWTQIARGNLERLLKSRV